MRRNCAAAERAPEIDPEKRQKTNTGDERNLSGHRQNGQSKSAAANPCRFARQASHLGRHRTDQGGKREDQKDVGDIAANDVPERDGRRPGKCSAERGDKFRSRGPEAYQREADDQRRHAKTTRHADSAAHQKIAANKQSHKANGHEYQVQGNHPNGSRAGLQQTVLIKCVGSKARSSRDAK